MGLLERMFGKKITNKSANKITPIADPIFSSEDDWAQVPAFLPADSDEYELVSIIATSIAMGDQPHAQFVITDIKKRNPEVHLVSLIAASIAAGAIPESNLVVKKISISK